MTPPDEGPRERTLLEQVGGVEVIHRLEEDFYDRVLGHPVLCQVFGERRPGHVDHLTAFTAESFGGDDRFTRELGFAHLIDVHRGLRITEEQRTRLVQLYLDAMDAVGRGPHRRGALLPVRSATRSCRTGCELAWRVDEHGCRRLNPEGLYGRRKMTALVRRHLPETSPGSVDRAMRALGLNGIPRSKGIRTTIPAKDGTRAGDLLNRVFTASAPNRTWVLNFTYCRAWAGWAYVAFVVDVYAQKVLAWHAATVRDADLVLTPLKMAIWQRGREGHPIVAGELVGHSDAGRRYTAIRYTEHLELEGGKPSIGSVGDAYDNALMECVIGLYKTECIRTTSFTPVRIAPSPTSSTPPPAGSTGTTSDACTVASDLRK